MTADEPVIPAFLLKGSPEPMPAPAAVTPKREPSSEQLTAAMLAYDMSLPLDTKRAPLPEHVTALRAALVAALSKG